MLNAILGKIKDLSPSVPQSSRMHAMQYAVLYVQNHFKEQIRLEDVSRTVNYAPNYFSNQFKAYTGISFKKYVMDLQFSLAEKLLEYTALSVTEICYQCGFRDFSNFMAYFKKRNGVPPNEYRRRLHSGKAPKSVCEKVESRDRF
jgi:AraC-like DNA-binding protein